MSRKSSKLIVNNVNGENSSECAPPVENTADQIFRVKTQLASIVHQFSDGMKLSHIQKNYKATFGHAINVGEYGKANYRELIQQFPELFIIKSNNYFVLTKNYEKDLPRKELLQIEACPIPEPFLDKVTVGQYMEVKIHNIYDPSKFWMVIYNKELDLFMQLLKSFYDDVNHQYRLPESVIRVNYLCIVSRNSQYHRGVIIAAKFMKSDVVRVFLIDTGFIVNVSVKDLFYIHKKFVSVNRFSVRACMAYICPKASPMWDMNALKTFCNLICKYRLLAKICDIDEFNQVLYVAIRDLYPHFCEFVNVVLVENNVAKYVFDSENNEQEVDTEQEVGETLNNKLELSLPKNLQVKMEGPYLLPSFQMLESGKVPCSLMEFNQIKNMDVNLAILMPNYFNCIENDDNCF